MVHLVQLCARPPHTRGLKEQAGNASSNHVLQTLKLHVLISPSESHFIVILVIIALKKIHSEGPVC